MQIKSNFRICDFCGKHKNGFNDHSECSKKLQKLHKPKKSKAHKAYSSEKKINGFIKRWHLN